MTLKSKEYLKNCGRKSGQAMAGPLTTAPDSDLQHATISLRSMVS